MKPEISLDGGRTFLALTDVPDDVIAENWLAFSDAVALRNHRVYEPHPYSQRELLALLLLPGEGPIVIDIERPGIFKRLFAWILRRF